MKVQVKCVLFLKIKVILRVSVAERVASGRGFFNSIIKNKIMYM